jgi:hypothetical protein
MIGRLSNGEPRVESEINTNFAFLQDSYQRMKHKPDDRMGNTSSSSQWKPSAVYGGATGLDV